MNRLVKVDWKDELYAGRDGNEITDMVFKFYCLASEFLPSLLGTFHH